MNPPSDSTPSLIFSLFGACSLLRCCSLGGGDGWRRGGVSAASCFVVALAKLRARSTDSRRSVGCPASTHFDHALRMTADMVALIAGLYVRYFLPRVLEPTFIAHLAVPSLPVPAYRHFRELNGSPQCSSRLLGNVIKWMFVDERFWCFVCAGESKQDYWRVWASDCRSLTDHSKTHSYCER